MDFIAQTAPLFTALFSVVNRPLTVEVFGERHREQAARLLSEQFCKREPLCRLLGIQRANIDALFREQVDFVAAQGLGIVAVDAQGNVRGVITAEDDATPFVPSSTIVGADVEIIHTLLDSLRLPAAMQATAPGQAYRCGLAAVDSQQRRQGAILLMMVVALFRHLQAKGFHRGYAKVTNAGVAKKLHFFERIFRRRFFTPVAEVRPAEFQYHGRYPFHAFRGVASLYTWPMAFNTPHAK